MRGSSLGSEHAQNARSTSNIEHRLAFEKVNIVNDRGPVRSRPDSILQHLLVDTYSNQRPKRFVRSHATNKAQLTTTAVTRRTSRKTRQTGRVMDWISTHQNERKNRRNCETETKEVWAFRVSASSQPLRPGVFKKKTMRNVLISRGHVSITMPFRMSSGRRCHLSSFFRLPLFRMKRKAKTPKVGEGGERWDVNGQKKGLSIKLSKLTFCHVISAVFESEKKIQRKKYMRSFQF